MHRLVTFKAIRTGDRTGALHPLQYAFGVEKACTGVLGGQRYRPVSPNPPYSQRARYRPVSIPSAHATVPFPPTHPIPSALRVWTLLRLRAQPPRTSRPRSELAAERRTSRRRTGRRVWRPVCRICPRFGARSSLGRWWR
jgi:hypothetical protein